MSLLERLTRHEGNIPVVYDDFDGHPLVKGCTVKGNPTIGIGILLSAPGGLTQDEITYLANNRIVKLRVALVKLFPWFIGLSPIRQDVITEMAYQLGISGLAHFPKMIHALEAKDYDTAAREMINSNWRKQTPERCEELAALMLNNTEEV